MGVFYGEMQLAGDTARLPAIVTLDAGRLRVSSGRSEIGDWPTADIRIAEHGPLSVEIKAEGEALILYLVEHHRFLADTESIRNRPEKKVRRERVHPAFRRGAEPDETLAEELKGDISREMRPLMEEARYLLSLIPGGAPLWIGLAAAVALVVFLPKIILGITLLVGVVALAAGGITYADTNLAVRLPDALTPIRLIAIGAIRTLVV
jgi:hypothetical protein